MRRKLRKNALPFSRQRLRQAAGMTSPRFHQQPQELKCSNSVTTCIVVLSSRFYFWKNRQRRRNPRRNVMGTTDRRGCLVPKHLEILKFGCWNRLSELCNEMAGRTVTGVTDRHRPLVEILGLWTLRRPAGRTVAGTTARQRLRKSQAESDFLTRFKGRFGTILSLIIDFVGLY